MIASTLAILGASLIGSAHCAAMCGGFVCFYTGSAVGGSAPGIPFRSALQSHAMYNVGRLMAYTTLGALAGVLGGHVTHLAAWAGIARGATILAGVLMIIWAGSAIVASRGVTMPQVRAPIIWQQTIGRLLNALRGQQMSVRAVVTGLLTGLIPCGWLYVFVTAAGATASPVDGAIVMAVFWLGTLPALIAVGVGAQRLLAPFRTRLPQLSAAVVMVIGMMAVVGRVAFSHAH